MTKINQTYAGPLFSRHILAGMAEMVDDVQDALVSRAQDAQERPRCIQIPVLATE